MISQIRIYTINKGEMDNFLKHFKEPGSTAVTTSCCPQAILKICGSS